MPASLPRHCARSHYSIFYSRIFSSIGNPNPSLRTRTIYEHTHTSIHFNSPYNDCTAIHFSYLSPLPCTFPFCHIISPQHLITAAVQGKSKAKPGSDVICTAMAFSTITFDYSTLLHTQPGVGFQKSGGLAETSRRENCEGWTIHTLY